MPWPSTAAATSMWPTIMAGTVSKFAPGSTTPSATLTGLNVPRALAFDGSGNLYVANMGNNTVSKFAPGSITSPTAGGVVIRSSLSGRPMSLGGTNNAVAGINLTDAELAQIQTAFTGTVTIGDTSQLIVDFSNERPPFPAAGLRSMVGRPATALRFRLRGPPATTT